eukprot:7531848-Pyramimonas_sp.AAC.1
MWDMWHRGQEATRRSKKLNFLASMNQRVRRLFKPAAIAVGIEPHRVQGDPPSRIQRACARAAKSDGALGVQVPEMRPCWLFLCCAC